MSTRYKRDLRGCPEVKHRALQNTACSSFSRKARTRLSSSLLSGPSSGSFVICGARDSDDIFCYPASLYHWPRPRPLIKVNMRASYFSVTTQSTFAEEPYVTLTNWDTLKVSQPRERLTLLAMFSPTKQPGDSSYLISKAQALASEIVRQLGTVLCQQAKASW